MQAKEGIVLGPEDPNARPYTAGPRPTHRGAPTVRVYRGGWWLPLALGVGIPALFVFGIFIFTLLMTLGLVVLLLRGLFGGGSRTVAGRR